nr:proline-rich protein 23A-like [Oryctolagus cuniculus]
MRGVRPRSPSACPEPAGPPQPGAAGPAKRRRVQEPAAAEPGPQPGLPAPPAAPPASALPSVVVVVLAAGCALQLPLDDVDLLLEPAPTAVLSVSLPGHTLLLVPEGLLEAAGQGPSPGGLALAAVLDAAAEAVVVQQQQQQQQQGLVCSAPTEMAGQAEAFEDEDDADPELLALRVDPAAGWAAGLCLGAARGSSPGSAFHLDWELWRPLPGSPLQPLPASPSPGPPEPPGRPQRPPRPACKARRRLFQE